MRRNLSQLISFADTHSVIVDTTSTKVVDKRIVKVLVWYDNEARYAKRLLEPVEYLSEKK